MSEQSKSSLNRSTEILDDLVTQGQDGARDYAGRQRLRTEGWQVVNIADNVHPDEPLSYVQLTEARHAKIALNVYQPHQEDEMHCHPGSEHIFMVFQGELHIYGINKGEDVVLKPGQLVHVNASYYYRLANETDRVTVLYQVATKPAKPVKISRYSYRGPGGIDPTTLETA